MLHQILLHDCDVHFIIRSAGIVEVDLCAVFTAYVCGYVSSQEQTAGREHEPPLLSLRPLEPVRLETDGWAC